MTAIALRETAPPYERPSLASVLDALVASAREVAEGALGTPDLDVMATREGFASFGAGAHITLIADSPVHLGFGGTAAACERLARALLAMDDADPIAPAEVADAIAEIANMMAGGVKRRLAERPGAPLARVGLPMFIRAAVEPSAELESRVATVRMVGEPVELFVVRRAPMIAADDE